MAHLIRHIRRHRGLRARRRVALVAGDCGSGRCGHGGGRPGVPSVQRLRALKAATGRRWLGRRSERPACTARRRLREQPAPPRQRRRDCRSSRHGAAAGATGGAFGTAATGVEGCTRRRMALVTGDCGSGRRWHGGGGDDCGSSGRRHGSGADGCRRCRHGDGSGGDRGTSAQRRRALKRRPAQLPALAPKPACARDCVAHMPGQGFACRLIPALVHGRLDIGDLEPGFVVAHCGASRGVIHCNAFDTRHLANPLFHSVHAQCRQHVVHFNNARLHRASSTAFTFNSSCYISNHPWSRGHYRHRGRPIGTLGGPDHYDLSRL